MIHPDRTGHDRVRIQSGQSRHVIYLPPFHAQQSTRIFTSLPHHPSLLYTADIGYPHSPFIFFLPLPAASCGLGRWGGGCGRRAEMEVVKYASRHSFFFFLEREK